MAIDMEHAYYEVGETRAAPREFPFRWHRSLGEIKRGVPPPASIPGLIAELERRIDEP